MRILLLNHNVMWRGTYVRCHHFARWLARFGHRVTILTGAPEYIVTPREHYVDSVRIVTMPDILGRRFRNGGLGPIETILRCLHILGNEYDVVESFDHRPTVLYPALVARFLSRIPLVSEWTDLHGTGGSLSERPAWVQTLIGRYEDFTEQWSKTLARQLVAISGGLAHRARELGIPPERVHYIPGGADIETIKPLDKATARRALGLPEHKRIVAYTGYSHYDMEAFLATLAEVLRLRQDTILATTGAALPRQGLDRLPRDRVIELGFLPFDKYTAFLPAADLFVFPFQNRTVNIGRWPNKIGDYMAAGRPTVSNRTGDLIPLFQDHAIGLLASDEPTDVAEKILTILDDPVLAEELGNNARRAAEERYDWKHLSGCLESVLRLAVES